MKKRILMFVITAIATLGIISCGKPAEPEVKTLTIENVNEYIVKLGEYKNLEVEAENEEVTDDLVDYYSGYFFKMDAQDLTGWEAKNGDTVVMNYRGTIDGVPFSGGTANNQELVLGSNSFIPGFEDGLLGVVAGDNRTLNLTFPEEYYDEYKGKDVVFEVTVLYVVPEFTDEGVAALNSETFSNVSEYKYYVEKALEEYVLEDYNNGVVQTAVDEIIANSEFKEFPESFMEEQKQLVVSQYAETAAQYNLDVATYLQYCGTTLEDLTDLYAKQQVVFYAICNNEGLYPSEEDIASNAQLVSEYMGYESVEAFYAETSKTEFTNTLIGSNVFEYLLKVTNVKVSE